MSVFKIAIAGHVDHGKSTLIGRILSETGQIFTDRFQKIENVCQQKGMKFEYAFLLDAFEVEQKQGITIDKLEIPWKYKNEKYIFIDTPGHKEFIKNMFSGISTANMAVIMVDALEGVEAQTKQHLSLLNLMGVKNIIFVINKIDKVDFQQKAFEKIETQINSLLHELKLPNFPIIPISAYFGDNLFTQSKQLSWYKGSPLIDLVQSLRNNLNITNSIPRMTIQDIYKFDDRRIYAGLVLSGEFNIGDKITFHPSGSESTIVSFENWGNSPIKSKLEANEVVSMTLADPLFIAKGEIASLKKQAPLISNKLNATVFWFGKTLPELNKKYILKISNQKHEIHIQQFKEENNSILKLNIHSRTPIVYDLQKSETRLNRFVILDEFQIVSAGVIGNEIENQNIQEIKNPIFWLTGLSGAGKTTLANSLKTLLSAQQMSPVVLDGDEIRKGINKDLGFDDHSRIEQSRRTAEMAKILLKQNHAVIVSLISPLHEARAIAKEILNDFDFFEVFVDTPIEVCTGRDPKNLYQTSQSNLMPGRDSLFERPVSPNITICDYTCEPIVNAEKILNEYLMSKNKDEILTKKV